MLLELPRGVTGERHQSLEGVVALDQPVAVGPGSYLLEAFERGHGGEGRGRPEHGELLVALHIVVNLAVENLGLAVEALALDQEGDGDGGPGTVAEDPVALLSPYLSLGGGVAPGVENVDLCVLLLPMTE